MMVGVAVAMHAFQVLIASVSELNSRKIMSSSFPEAPKTGLI